MTKVCVHAVVSGHVQGVCFRDNTRKKANLLGLNGWVKNLDSREVEVMVCGDKERVTEMVEWLKQGPTAARVEKVNWQEVPAQDFQSFRIEY